MKRLLIVFLAICTLCSGCLEPPVDQEKEAFLVAADFVQNSQTYLFNGYDLQVLDVVKLEECEPCYAFSFQYRSDYSGWGNRSRDNPAKKLTVHQIVVSVKNKKVTQAVIDRRYDELTQTLIERSEFVNPMDGFFAGR